MSTPRTHLLINYPKFPPPLKQCLAERGIVLVENDWRPVPDLLEQTLACVVDFGGSVKHPFRALRWSWRLSRYGVPVFAWNRDAPHNNNLRPWKLALFDSLRPLDIYATHSLIDSRWNFADTVLYLPNAADTSAYNLRGDSGRVITRLRNQESYRWDVSFFGALDGNRYQEAVSRQKFFALLAERLDALSISHRFVDNSCTSLSVDEQIELMQTSRININFGARCDFGNFPASGLPERYFGIPACGGFLLSDHRVHLGDCFRIGEHLDTFADLDDCVAKIRFYLDNFLVARSLAEAGWRHVMTYHTYAKRAEELHAVLIDWHTGRRGLIK